MQKTYVIFGGTTGISAVVAANLKEEGHQVVTISRSQSNENATLHWQHEVGQPFTFNAPEKIDGLLFAPGSINLKPFRALKPADFLEAFELNVLGAVNALQWAQKSFADQASVVLFSTVAVQQGMPFHAAVAAAKGGVEGLVRSLAAEWAPKIRVNGIAPSLTDTPLAERLLNNDAKKEGASKRHPLQRYGTATDVANAALFLLSDKSSWITGQILGVDGGMSALKLG